MKDLRKLIREEIERIYLEMNVDEADLSTHLSKDRLFQRIMNPSPRKVGFRVSGNPRDKNPSSFHEVGTRAISSDDLADIKYKLDVIEKYKFPKLKSFAVRLASLYIKPETVDYYSEADKIAARGKTLYYLDYDSESYGNEIYVVIRMDVATTIMFVEGNQPLDNRYFAVDTMIKNFDVIVQKKIR